MIQYTFYDTTQIAYVTNQKKVLFVHHGDHRAGAPLSMLYTMLEIKKHGYLPIVGLAIPSPELKDLYNSNGFETVNMSFLNMIYFWSANRMQWWKPSTYRIIVNVLLNNNTSIKLFYEMLKKYNIDIVHLNSVSLITLVPSLIKRKTNFVWHIREHGPNIKSILYWYFRRVMIRAPKIIFLSQTEKVSWIGNHKNGIVIYNFLQAEKYKLEYDNSIMKRNLKLNNEKIILYLGGIKYHKGIVVLIEALWKLKNKGINFKCIMPDSKIEDVNDQKLNLVKKTISKFFNTPKLDLYKYIKDKILQYNLSSECILLPFDTEIGKYISLADVLVFPATEPHFARPVIEASLMKKAVILTDWPVLKEISIPGETCIMIKPNNAKELSSAIETIFKSSKLRKKLGMNGYEFAIKNFTAESQIPNILKVYSSFIDG